MKIKRLEAVLIIFPLIVIISALSSCANSAQAPVPLPYQIKEQINKDFIIIRDQELKSYLNGLVFRLVANYGDQISIEIAKDKHAFAKSFPGSIVLVSTSLLQSCSSESELAFVIAHELGHIVLGHHTLAVKGISLEELRERELAADYFAANAIIRAGYSLNGAFSSIQRLTDIWDFYGTHSDGYPSSSERLVLLQNQMMNQACLSTGSCLMGGIGNTRDYVKFRMRLQTILR